MDGEKEKTIQNLPGCCNRLRSCVFGNICPFVFCVEKETRIVCRFTNIDLNKLETGDRVAVSFSGPVMETYPVQLGQVKQVRLNPL